MDRTKLGGAVTAFGLSIFGIPAALVAGGVNVIPKWLSLGLMVFGSLAAAAGHFFSMVYASGTDATQQALIDALTKRVNTNSNDTDFIVKALNMKPPAPAAETTATPAPVQTTKDPAK